MSSFTITDLPNHTRAVLGPQFATAVVEGLLTGLISNFAYRLWKDDFAERRTIQAIMIFVTLLAYLQTAVTFYNVYETIVTNFANWAFILNSDWSPKVRILVVCLQSMPTKAILIWRCRLLIRQKYQSPFIVCLGFLYLLDLAMWAIVLERAFKATGTSSTIDPLLIVTQAIPIAFDIVLTVSLTFFLLPSRPNIFTKSFTTTVYRLVFFMWEVSVPSTLTLIVGFALFMTIYTKSNWASFFQQIVGQMYVITLFVALMGMQIAPSHSDQNGSLSQLGSINVTWRRPDGPSASNCAPDFELQSFPASLRSSSITSLEEGTDSPFPSPSPTTSNKSPSISRPRSRHLSKNRNSRASQKQNQGSTPRLSLGGLGSLSLGLGRSRSRASSMAGNKMMPKSPKSPKYGVDLGLGGGVTEEIVNADCDPERIHEIALDIGSGGVDEREKQDGVEGKSDGFDGRDSDSAKQRYLNPARDGPGTPQ